VPQTAKLLPLLRCPETGQALRLEGTELCSEDGRARYQRHQGIWDLRRAPDRLKIDVPWYSPWRDLERMKIGPPGELHHPDLPYHLDPYLASIPGEQGDGRRILEIGCGERQCEGWFVPRGFDYVGIDVDVRGLGPNLLADGHNLPFWDERFDLVCSMAVLQHVPSPLKMAVEAARVLRPGGVLFGSSAFVYGWTDRASFYHMSHGGLLMLLRQAGLRDVRVWPDWHYWQSIANVSFSKTGAKPWRWAAEKMLKGLDWSFIQASNAARGVMGRPPLDEDIRQVELAGSLSFMARKPG
jgi:SAM-dependent methyltransferase